MSEASAASPMSPERRAPRRRVDAHLRSLVLRERVLIGLGFVGRGWAVGLLAASWLVASAVFEVREEASTAALVLLVGVGLFGVALPLFRGRWAQAGDERRQARRVERLSPGLRGRLVTLAERVGGRVPLGESEAVLDKMASRSIALVEATPPGRVHPALGSVAATAVLGASSLVFLGVALIAGPGQVWGYWSGLGEQGASELPEGPVGNGEVAKVGDLVLRYVYPSYTGLEPREIENGTGEAHGPPGTLVEVRLRSASVVDSASIVVDANDPVPAAVAGEGRVVVGSFTIGAESGTWRVDTVVDGAAASSRAFAIVAEADLPPEVVLEGDDTIEVAVNQPIALGWRVRDDYGVRRVVVLLGGVESEPPLAEPRERRAEVTGPGLPAPFALGLRAGDRVELAVAGWDNDEVSGSKMGVSRTIEVIVLGADATDIVVEGRQRELRDLLVDLLAPFVVERWPPAAPTTTGYARWGADVAARLVPLQTFVEQRYGERLPGGPEGEAIERVSRAGNEIVRFTQTAFATGGAAPAAADVATAKALREKAIGTIENQVLALDYFIQRKAWKRLEEEAKGLRDVAQRTGGEVEAAKTAAQLTELLERTEAAAAALKKDAGDLSEGHLRDRVEPRVDELAAVGEEARAALRAGRFEEAKELARRQTRQAGELGQQIADDMERRREKDREAQERRETLEKELQSLQAAERALAEKTAELARSDDAGAAAQMEKLWKSLAARAERHERMAVGASELADRFQGPVEQRLAASGEQQARDLKDVVANQDVDAAREKLKQMEATWGKGDRPDLAGDARQMQATLDEVQRLSDKMSPKTKQATQRLAESQVGLSERGQRAAEAARKVAQELPTRPEGIEEGMGESNEAMGRSGGHLTRGAPTPAQGAQQSSVDGLQKALDALRQAMEALENDGEGGESEGSGGADRAAAEQIRIPSPELFRTPEQYRRELIQGMEGEVPDEYRALKKRYYEELVNQ